MKVWVFMLLGAILTLPAGMIVNHLSHLLWGRSAPPSLSLKGYFTIISAFLCLTMAANQFNNAATELQNRSVAQLSSAPAPTPIVIKEKVYVIPESIPPRAEATSNAKNTLTRIDPPSDKFAEQNVSPNPPDDLAKQRELAQLQERDKQKRDRLLEEEKRRQFFATLHTRTGLR